MPSTIADEAFKGCGQKVGLDIWRIEKLKVVPVPKKLYGQFYTGDSYIVLTTKKHHSSDKLLWDIHFWLGSETSTDEAGAAAYKTVELDDSLGGAPVQHREVQDHESAEFLSNFKKGIRYLEGGVASGFKHVEDEKPAKRLFRVKGKKQVRVRQVACKLASLNQGDVFILDDGEVIHQWNPPKSNRMERIKASVVSKEIRDETHKGKAKIRIIEGTWENDDDFFKALGERGKIASAAAGGKDDSHEEKMDREVRLFRVSDASGKIEVKPVYSAPLEQKHLDSKDTFILDTGSSASGLFVWIGKKCTKKEKEFAIVTAPKFLKEREYPPHTKVTTVIDGGEPPVFKQFFKDWRDPEDQRGLGTQYHRHKIAKTQPEIKIDYNLMLARNAGQTPGLMPDDGKGKVEIWRVQNMALSPVKKENYGMFFGGDSYVVKYEATNKAKDVILYVWMGKKSSLDEKETAMKEANKMDAEMGGKPIVMRINQGFEPEHFLRIFAGKIIVFLGGHESGFKSLQSHDTYDPKGVRLFHVRGTTEVNTRAVQVEEKASSLNTNDVFVLDAADATYVWVGRGRHKGVLSTIKSAITGASASEKAMGLDVAKRLSKNKITEVKEGSEPLSFWNFLGGKAEYNTAPETGVKPVLPARIFHLSNETGKLLVNPLGADFGQEDLDTDDVIILDCNDCIFCWIGKDADEQEKTEAEKIAQEYVTADPSPRKGDEVTIVTVKQGRELPYFTCHFPSWDPEYWDHLGDWEKIKAELEK